MNAAGQRVCLCMIVRNEAPVIRRCLDSVRPLIDAWCVVDTGSADGTQALVREHLSGLPGELLERPWVDFAHNRSEALALARGRGDYVLVIDADETLERAPGFELPLLDADSYNLEVRYGGTTYLRKALVRDALGWVYRGVLHEYIHCDQARTEEFLPGLVTVPHPDGARARDPLTYRRDALVLERALLDAPDDTRNVFYLAQSYRDAGDLEQALRAYRRRVELGGWPEEVWYSLYQIAQIEERRQKPWGEVMEHYLAAFRFMPDRAGPLYRIGMHYQSQGAYPLSHLFFARAQAIPPPGPQRLFVERAVYDYLLPIEHAVACYYVGEHAEAIATDNRLLASGALPAAAFDQVVRNRRFSLDALQPVPSPPAEPGPLFVLVPPREHGPALDDLVESLAQQTEPFRAWFVERGGRAGLAARLPADDERFAVVGPVANGDPLALGLLDRLPPDALVLLLEADDRLASSSALSDVRAAFADPLTSLAYGQHRLPDGRTGSAAPAPADAPFHERGSDWAAGSPLAFRARLWLSAGPRDDARGALWGAAGFRGTRFLDGVLTARVAPSPAPAAVPAARGSAPLVSCLVVTHDRLALAKRAIRAYAAQTYPHRELVVVTDGSARYRAALQRYADAIGCPSFRLVGVDEPGSSLGRLRNLSLDAAEGDVVCQWDDDDCCHPDRLAVQLETMARADGRACFMTDHLQFLESERLMTWVDWTLGGREGREQLLPGTLMAYRDRRFRYPEEGAFARQGEDTMYLYALCDAVPVVPLRHQGHLYLYTYHGRNTFSKEHHHRLAQFGAPAAYLQDREAVIRQASAHYPVPRPFAVVGSDGPAFVVNE
ncbi:MAG: glycosyltransferase [Vicinamibacteria bacterium]